MKKNLNIIILGLAALSLSSCKTLYGKYERPDVKTSGIVRDVASDTDSGYGDQVRVCWCVVGTVRYR